MKKKLFSLFMVAILGLSTLCMGCGNGETTESASESGGETAESTVETEKSDDSSAGTYDGTVTIAMTTWVGYAPLLIAKEKGFFENYGVDVEIIQMDSGSDKRSALQAGEIQGYPAATSSGMMTAAAGVDVVQVCGIDYSNGADGIVAINEIETIEDLKGKTVALDQSGSASLFFFQYVLAQYDMTLDDITVVDMGSSDAGAAFVAGQVDAAVTWEPYLTNGDETDFGHILADSSSYNEAVAETLLMDAEFTKEYPETVKGIVQGWYDALDFLESNQEEAYQIMADGIGQDISDVEGNIGDVKFLDEEATIELFGSADGDSTLKNVCGMIIDFWTESGIIENDVDVDNTISYDFIHTGLK